MAKRRISAATRERLRAMRQKYGLGEYKRAGARKARTRSVYMARRGYGKKRQRARIGGAMKWLKGGMLAKSMIPAFAVGVFAGDMVDRFTGGNSLLKYAALGVVGGVPAIAGSALAPQIKGAIGMGNSSSGSSSGGYY